MEEGALWGLGEGLKNKAADMAAELVA